MKNKYLGIVYVVLCVGALAGGGFAIWHVTHQNGPSKASDSSADAGQASSDSSTSQLNVTQTQPSTSASDLGQLGGTNGQNLTGQGNTSDGSATNGSSSSGASWPDPSTFTQYDKYKTSQQALFGDVVTGTGTALAAGHKAAVYYKGFLTNGTVFDQSRPDSSGNLQPFVFTEGAHQVISGWEQALAGMKVGGARLLIVPPAAGYGSTAQNGIPANSVLVFEVQLLQVQ
ncbi:MAG TPA: FKBP-type peptidyl-prolyl cis-trans isomerase [Candidatus Saccharimonadales bacterium]|nr:FKBP-type peptidyl-prolyl cis-trans isomerase [Candidatus Saccharimonadales bacterium]